MRRSIAFESALLIPRSPLRDLPSLACLDNSAGTRHRCEPLRHPMPKEERWAGQIVMSEILEGNVNIDARAKMRSTSDSTSFTPTACLCAEMSFSHERRGTIREALPATRLRLSWEQHPPTNL